MSNEKHHYRKVFKSDHLGSADLEEMIEEKKPLIFTVVKVQQEFGAKVAGKKIDANIAYFKEGIKPLVLNATNSKIMKKLAGGSPFVEDWKNIPIELYIDASVRMKGEVVGGVRIKEEPPKILTQKEIEEIKTKVSAITDIKALTTYYNSDILFKTNKDVVDAFRKRNGELKPKA
jgi:hypothetical protein